MASQKTVPPSANKFIEVGIEIVSCAICHDTFTDEHIAIQIIACGHQFGKNCLEEWLRQKNLTGTCPMCRGVLFNASNNPDRRSRVRQVSPGTLPPIFASDAPVSPTRFIEYYGQTLNVRRSAQDGFLSRLWSGIMNPPPGDQVTCAVRVIMLAFEEFPGPEYNALMRYISRISSIGLQATWSTCLITSLVNTLSYFARCCQKGFILSLATWQAVMRYQLHAGNDTLNWLEIRNAAWTLHGLHSEGRSTGEHWFKLHLFFVLLGIHRSQQRLPVYGARELRELIHILGCDDPFGTLGQDGATRLFLLAAMHVLELSKIFDRPCRDARGLRLLNENTSRQLLKQDVEALWLEGMTLAAKEMAEGRPIL
ncbi:Zinc finger family protein [Pyrenophora teres f. maculata]|nr:Zinc finger family protein [Pyrenophora teres f. maculata]